MVEHTDTSIYFRHTRPVPNPPDGSPGGLFSQWITCISRKALHMLSVKPTSAKQVFHDLCNGEEIIHIHVIPRPQNLMVLKILQHHMKGHVLQESCCCLCTQRSPPYIKSVRTKKNLKPIASSLFQRLLCSTPVICLQLSFL